MSVLPNNHADKWAVWGYPEDPSWDGETYDIGYMTDSGTGGTIAEGLSKEDAEFIISAVRAFIGPRLAGEVES